MKPAIKIGEITNTNCIAYLNGMSTSAMASSHVAIALSHSSRDGHISVLAVHVVSSRARIIAQPDTKVLNLQWASVMNLLGKKV